MATFRRWQALTHLSMPKTWRIPQSARPAARRQHRAPARRPRRHAEQDVPKRPRTVPHGDRAALDQPLSWRLDFRNHNAAAQAKLRMLRCRPCARLTRGAHLLVRVHVLRLLRGKQARRSMSELRRRVRSTADPAALQTREIPAVERPGLQPAVVRHCALMPPRRRRPMADWKIRGRPRLLGR